MSKKAKSEVTDNSADTVMDGVLSENQAKLNKLNSSIQAAYERRRKIITDSKLYTYDKLSQLYGGAEGQALLDAVTAEHTLIGKLTDSGMSYADIEGLVDSSDGADSKSGDDADSGSADDEFVGQTSFFGDNSYKD
ncbi:hypothetical protein [uncultured Ruminococcus sp.]|jgi:hypothetical protein|uniref:hypothetical protein n=1 Tax=uncultured Ruminococcus sp. TaxID=165186 RepID=UPI0025EDC69A|nr:hypothetical protein [uncultured Ruminococcus sp.]